MAFADATGARTILSGAVPVKVTLAAGVTTKPGDLLGYSSGWKLADGNGGIPAKLVAGQSGTACEIQAYAAAYVDGFTGGTAGAALFLSDTAGGYSDTTGTSKQRVGVMASATAAFIGFAVGGAVLESGDGIVMGSSSTHATDSAAAGSAIGVYVDPTGITGRYNTLCVESNLAPATDASPVGCYAIRGVAGVKTGKTTTGTTAAYLAGVQGKLAVAGTLGNDGAGAIYACAVLAQIGTGGTYGTETQVYGLWADNQRTDALPTLSHMVNITNNGGTVRDFFHLYGNLAVSRFLTAENAGAAIVVGAGTYSTADGYLLINVDGSDYRIPFFTAVD